MYWWSYSGVFFFSSRRRHTRYWRDWSSDVCSSDLATINYANDFDGWLVGHHGYKPTGSSGTDGAYRSSRYWGGILLKSKYLNEPIVRSEERRVGKECRSRWSPYH